MKESSDICIEDRWCKFKEAIERGAKTAAMLLANPEIRSSGQTLEDIWKLAEEIVAKRQRSDTHIPASSSTPRTSQGNTLTMTNILE
ncbi:hypothetical protein Pmar_PMAR002937 [Perkinsus marinus ATCC 50983]|uniref:Uncharacterized protein n=1 Tax=Perkinsus marinus (strain ATCC 50983 / TXsc) TaxID=423536 RepID=C5LQY2_PERM5|nr:hypothetical protein Pmar_PMAR002937 [Perkinsus marinus ATCC 50983]EER00867.1 hypothetical protein Pmar_PMAR002937 [Perkinsus marinus ATCC 50983]|eukprot:XP_002768149.1 hypothetical protein Pmar_PMAR002937 [Perkinsus marinus ATCC 50983]